MFSEFLDRVLYRDAKMSSHPGYYSGRGATTSDLRDEKLEAIWSAIQKERGDEAAKAFVSMVFAMPSLAATDFLITLARLESNGFRWQKRLCSDVKGIYPEDEGSAWGTIGSMLGGMNRPEHDQTPSIRNAFLKRHGRKPPKRKVRNAAGKLVDAPFSYDVWY